MKAKIKYIFNCSKHTIYICLLVLVSIFGIGQHLQAQCNIPTVNPDFELPVLTCGTPVTSPCYQDETDSLTAGWRTTEADHQIEYWQSDFNGGSGKVPAYSGNQFVELNANAIGGLYQDYSTPAPVVFNFSYAHRGRTGIDEMAVLAGPPGGPYDTLQYEKDNNTAWGLHTGAYTVPAGQPVTRFEFVAITTANNDPTEGNFLDDINFTANNGVISGNFTLACTNTNNSSVTPIAAGFGTWSQVSGPDNNPVIGSPNSDTTTISGFDAVGVYTYQWATFYCTTKLTVTVNHLNPVAPTTAPVTYCQGATSVALTATGTLPYWYTTPTGGVGVSPVFPSTATAGVTTYYVTQTINTCESVTRTPQVVTINGSPTITLGATSNGCLSATAQVVSLPYTATTNTPTTYSISNWSSGGFVNVTNAVLPAGSIVITVPAGAGAGTYTAKLTVTNANGCVSVTYPISVQITALPSIQLNAIASVCALSTTQTLNLVYTSTTGTPTTYSITGWSGGGFANVTNAALPASPIGIVVPAGTSGGTYTASLTVNNGTCTSKVYTITVTLIAPPTITLGAIAPVCFSTTAQTVTLPYTATSGAPLPTKYNINAWSGGTFANVTNAGLPASPINITVPASTAAGTYTANLTVNNLTCLSFPYSIGVTINPSVLTITNPAPGCLPGGVDITAAAVTAGSTPGSTFTYYTNAAATIVLATPTAVTTSGIYYIKSLTPGGCSQVQPVTVTINSQPTITLGATTPVCYSSTAQTVNLPYTATSLAPTTYSISGWSGGGFANVANVALPATPISIAVPAGVTSGTYTAILTVTNANGCVSIGYPISVTINALPTITLSPITAECFSVATQTVNLPYTIVTGAPTTYSIGGWSGGGFANVANVALPGSPIGIAVPAGVAVGTYTAILTVTNANGCVSIGYPISVTISALPTITLSPIAAVCFSAAIQTVNLPYTAVTGTPTTYSINGWSGGGFANITNAALSASPINITVPAGVSGGIYTANLTVNNGTCTSIVYPISVTINALPTITLSPVSICFFAGAQIVSLPYTTTTGGPTKYT
ncbi:MAG TPA: hypothetical protein VK705_04075, partial [Ferruginibacter sp.]|nr:hypothetical protein [Ferruginibacter sp.]